MEFIPGLALIVTVCILLLVGLNSKGMQYRSDRPEDDEHNPTWTQNGVKNASKNWKG